MSAPHPHPKTEAPSWVQRDPACLDAWGQDPSWRRGARAAVPPNGRKPGDGGTTGDALRLVAQQQAARHRRERERQRKEQDPALVWHHAEGCICPTCRKGRGEYVPTLQQLQERRKRRIGAEPGTVGYEPGDREEWLLTADDRVRWTRVVEAERDPKDKITRCELRPEWLGYLDSLLRKGALEELWQSQPHLARAFCGCAMDGRTQDNMAEAEGVSRRTIGRRVEQARSFLAERVG